MSDLVTVAHSLSEECGEGRFAEGGAGEGICMLLGIYSDKGRRDSNDDYGSMRMVNGVAIAALADGIGGADYGDVASRTAVVAALDALSSPPCTYLAPEFAWTSEVISRVEESVCGVKRSMGVEGAGTTLLVARQHPTRRSLVEMMWVGDTVALKYDASRQNFQRLGEPGRVESSGNSLDGAFGYGADLEGRVRYRSVELDPGDCLVLATDGVWDVPGVFESAAATLAMEQGPNSSSERLVRLAVDEFGGSDNATALVVKAVGGVRTRS